MGQQRPSIQQLELGVSNRWLLIRDWWYGIRHLQPWETSWWFEQRTSGL